MNLDNFRSLLYPLGFLASLFFSARFFAQWIQSEKKKQSHVTKLFWFLSLYGNLLMAIHGFIQLQFPVLMIQSFNGSIAWRNLDLMQNKPKSFRKTLVIMAAVLIATSLLFLVQGILFHTLAWMREPSFFWSKAKLPSVSRVWHIVGFIAMALFASRFWLQWWMAEKNRRSYLGISFWWISLFGAIFSLIYFIKLGDWVNIVGYSMGILPYFRNILLLKNKKSSKPSLERGIFLFAGEQSGDVIGGKLVEALKQKEPSLKIWGVGGSNMKAAGMEAFSDISRFHVMGFSDIFQAFPRLYSEFQKIKKRLLTNQPEVCVFIDYPDFNMKMASSLKKNGFRGKLIHYVCPSVWAWRKNRVFQLAKTLDVLLTILPFERDYFKNTALPVTYVGHPLVAAIDNYSYDTEWKQKCKIPSDKPLLAIFPGSRKAEIERNLALQINALKSFKEKYYFAISCAREDLEKEIRKIATPECFVVPHAFRYELMKDSFAALATSGTVILELGLHATPTVATYRLSSLNSLLAKFLFRISLPFYTLVNIICEKEVFPEFIHKFIDARKVEKAFHEILQNRQECIQDCKNLRSLLASKNASEVAAEVIVDSIKGNKSYEVPLP